MSGFFGIFNRNGKPVDKKIVEDMHMIAKVLELNQATIQRIIKRTKKNNSISIT